MKKLLAWRTPNVPGRRPDAFIQQMMQDLRAHGSEEHQRDWSRGGPATEKQGAAFPATCWMVGIW